MIESMKLLTYSFVTSRIKLSWNDILYAIEKNLINEDFAIEHAMVELSKREQFSEALIELASLVKGNCIHPYIDDLAMEESAHNNKNIAKKWLYVVLDWVFNNKEIYQDPLGLVEQIYAEFDYPENISTFVRYMPSSAPDLGTLKLNEARLYDNWLKYLKGQKKHYTSV